MRKYLLPHPPGPTAQIQCKNRLPIACVVLYCALNFIRHGLILHPKSQLVCSRGGNREEGAEEGGTKKGALTVEPTAKRRGVGVRQCIAGNRQTPSYRLYLKAMHSSAQHFSVPKQAPTTVFATLINQV